MAIHNKRYAAQVSLLVAVLPVVAQEHCFALKGGTAINLFVRDLPRLSVDIDLAFVKISSREEALLEIKAALERISSTLSGAPHGLGVVASKQIEGSVYGLLVSNREAQIKIEVSPVLRGLVHEVELRRIMPSAEEAFGFAEVPMVSFEDLYAGKIVAALDRQHPRDLFDVKLLLENEGISASLFRAFLVYLISGDDSIARLLNPAPKPLAEIYEKHFVGMTAEQVPLASLETARKDLVTALHRHMGEREKSFLLSFKRMEPDWGLLEIPHAAELPAVRWKLQNLAKMPREKHAEAVKALEKVLDQIKPE